MPTLPICFKIPSSVATSWATPTSDPSYADLQLIGLQFEFKHLIGANAGTARTKIACSQIYGFEDQFPLRLEVTDNIINAGCTAWEINGTGASQHLTQLPPDVSQSAYLYNRLQDFDSDCEFVYFGILDLNYKRQYFLEIHLSGCQIELRSNTTSDVPGAVYAPGPVFSLKLEGKTVNPKVFPDTPNPLRAAIAGVTVGTPCPPLWYMDN